MTNHQTPYQVEFLGGEDNVYFFFTKFRVGYLVKFKPSFYVLDAAPIVSDNVYELVIYFTTKVFTKLTALAIRRR